MSALPKSVQKQIDEANRIAQEVYPVGETPPAETPPAETPPAETPPVETPPETPPAETPPAETPLAETPPVDPDHKYKVLQGKYNAEVPRLQTALRSEQESSAELRQRLLNVEGVLASIQHVNSTPKPPAAPALPEVTDSEREQFGDDLIDLVERVAKRSTIPEIESRIGEVGQRVTQVDERVAQGETSVAESRRQKVFSDLDKHVPDWLVQNDDPNFMKWLELVDPMSGSSRGQLLATAMRASNSQQVIAIFSGFRSENAAGTSVVTPTPTPTPTPELTPPPEPQQTLDDFVAPGTPKTGTASAPNESGKRVWTQRDIAQLYADKNEFVKKGKPIPDELQALEKDLFLAQGEGRLSQ